MDGHLCRCGTYPRVMKAIKVASAKIANSIAGETR
jgi:aerobic-type carbon monoxide dehydrogenase small subunit (CoxS/CutS family)